MTLRQLGDVCTITMGQAPSGTTYNNEQLGVPLVAGASDLGERAPASSRWTSAPTQLCEVGDVILCIRATIGTRNWADKVYCLGRGVAGLKVDSDCLDSRFLWHWLDTATPELFRRARGATFLQVSKSDIETLMIDVPVSMEAQRRVADMLDRADAIRRKRKQAIALTDDLLRSAFLDMFGDPVSNPKAWPEALIGDVLSNIESGWSPVCQPRPAAVDEWGVLKLGAVTFGEYDDGQNKAFVTGVEPERRHEVKVGDVLFARKNTYEHVAACVLVTATRPRLVLPDLLFRLAPKPGLLPAFLWGVMSDHSKRKQVQAIAGGTAGSMPNISKERLRGIKIPVPPGALQQKFSRFVEKQTRAIRHIHSALALADQMSATLSQRAFGGSEE